MKIKTFTAVITAGAWMLTAGSAQAELQTQVVEYRHGDTVLEGYLAYDDDFSAQQPGVLVVHEWMGLGDHARKSARRLARLGYTALAVDMYGKGIRPKDAKEAGEQASIYKGNRALMRERIGAALEFLKEQPAVDANKIAAIGYCFGGTSVLELARGGADLKGVVSFHGGLSTPMPAEPGALKAKVLALHGAEDPYAPADEVRAFEDEMRAASADWQVVLYGGAVHAFTNPDAGNDASKGAAYNASADRRSWKAMKNFLAEVL